MVDKETSSLNDFSLAKKAAENQEFAERLLQRVIPRILQVVHSVVQKQECAEDIFQASTIEVLKSLNNFKGQGTLEAWAGQIAFRTAMRFISKQRATERKQSVLEETIIAENNGPETNTSRKEAYALLQKHLESMTENRRTPLLLHLIYGHTVREVSVLINTSENTVKDRLKAAVRELRIILDKSPELKQALLEVIS